jgi:hypothetical protein
MDRPKTSPEQAPGHYGAGYGEQVPADAPPRPAPKTDAEPLPATGVPTEAGKEAAPSASSSPGDEGNPVVFTPDDVHARPPDHPPTENAPESEKAGLIFERS